MVGDGGRRRRGGAAARRRAQGTENLTVEVGNCAELASPEARLACFDAQVEAARRARPGSDSAARQPPPARARLRSEAAIRTGEDGPRRTSARTSRARAVIAASSRSRSISWPGVAELGETVPNSYLITLDNGQVWRRTRPLAYPLRAGHEVRIYTQGRFGYRLTNRELPASS